MTNAAANIIPAEWKSISLEAMNEKAAMQTRVDRKYIVDAETAAKVLSTLDADASVMEIKGQRDFAYDSVYFDTPQMQSYHSAAYSRDDTFKIRTRSYLDSELTFLEVKTDGEQDMTVKKRIPYTFENRDTLTAEGHEYITAALGDILAGPVHKLEAVLTTGYRRTTVFLPQSEKNPVASRMTVDNALTWTPMSENILMAGVNYRNFHGNLVGTTYGLPNAVIIETKSGVEPSVADQHLWDAGITPREDFQVCNRYGGSEPAAGKQQVGRNPEDLDAPGTGRRHPPERGRHDRRGLPEAADRAFRSRLKRQSG